MRIIPENLIYHELIGLHVEVLSHSDKGLVGLKGRVIDETRYTLKVKTPRGVKTVLKMYGVFRFRLPSGIYVEVDGSLIVGRPEDRLKRMKL